MPIKAVYVERSRLTGHGLHEIREARRLASKQPGYTKTKNYIVHRKTIEFPQENGYVHGGRVRFSQGGNLVAL
jgi:hypothetical protein